MGDPLKGWTRQDAVLTDPFGMKDPMVCRHVPWTGARRGCAGVPAYPAAEDDFHIVRTTDVEVVGNEGFEEPAGEPRCLEHDGARDLDLGIDTSHQ